MPNSFAIPPHISFNRNLYSLNVWDVKSSWHIRMTIMDLPLTTWSYPETVLILKHMLPSIFSNVCFNDKKLPFKNEVKHTELGHLFEHILLEYLCIRKLSLGVNKVEFSGHTDWNWKIDPRGTFHIYVSKNREDSQIFSTSLKLAIGLFERIVLSDRITKTKQNADSNTYLRFRNLFVH